MRALLSQNLSFDQIPVDEPARCDLAIYHRAYNTYRRLIEVMNPEPGSLYWLMTKDEASAWAARHRDKKYTARRARAHAFGNALLHGTWMLLPRNVRRAYRGDVAFDATVVAAPARGRGKRSLFASSDPGAGWHRRDGDHDGGSTARADTKYSRTTSELLWAREAHTAISYGQNVPVIVLAMTLDVPGKRLAENVLTCIDALRDHGLPVGHFVADRAYLPGTKAEDLALPLRARNYRIVFDYTRDHLGQQASHAGALLIEGRWYSPGIPALLRDASIDYFLRQDDDPARISTTTYEQRIEQRKAYELHRKERPDDQGYQRLQCPAVGSSAAIRCPYREPHPKTVDRPLTRLLPVLLPKPRPQVCDQQTITVPPSAGAKYEQEYPYQSQRWAEQYTPGRQSVESMNSSLKHGAHLPIDDPQKRPRRGWIGQFISLVTMVVATNTRKIIAWLIDQIGVSSISTAPVARTRRRDLTHGWTTAPAN
ncbi:hypothetical protein [Microbacterium aurum]|jgi:hypothetical protein|uniref:hypothetical protein n=1 Tax=Microbacterium aurum TaxID=36805 RepID=UPI00248F17C8|nr:hypothetical protein [Microbacterium aurum]